MVREAGAAVLFSIIVQTSALDEARYQVVDGSHRFQVARIIVDPRRHLKEDYIDVAVYNTLDPEAMLELQHRVNLLTHDAVLEAAPSVLLNLKRASLQAPKRYIREDPDFATHLEPALGLHFPKGERPGQACEDSGVLLPGDAVPSPSSRLSDSRQPRTCGIFEARDAEMNRWLARAMLEGRSVVLRPPLLQRPISRSPFGRPSRPSCCSRPTMQLRWLPEPPHPLPAPTGRPGDPAVPSRPDRDLCLHELPQRAALPIPQGQVRLPAFSEELGELGCPFERLNETDVGNMPQEITFMDGRRLSRVRVGLPDARALPVRPALGGDGPPRHPRASKRMLKTVDRELREERRALREEAASEHPEPPKSEPAKRATLKALLSQAEPTSEAEAKAAEADDE
ncbi:hypothetical protein PAPYR_13227 [Paratrimastix pyriformis]|uniref:ParB/Sulfiredoxin domain-containing protein n=1 Tax=Paratrimastix pyriformis TaxID=342808 RepID=A0ABQ8U438_9EUKA|nr:hypothetical protein PAPYR_13227 [Paratrimastix pyriformis]